MSYWAESHCISTHYAVFPPLASYFCRILRPLPRRSWREENTFAAPLTTAIFIMRRDYENRARLPRTGVTPVSPFSRPLHARRAAATAARGRSTFGLLTGLSQAGREAAILRARRLNFSFHLFGAGMRFSGTGKASVRAHESVFEKLVSNYIQPTSGCGVIKIVIIN